MEEWRAVVGYEGKYEVSSFGNVRSSKGLLNGSVKRNGYKQVILCFQRPIKHINIHRLVAVAFIPNPDNKPQVNHIDGNKLNNNVTNLEWVTGSENSIHSCHVLGKKQNPPHHKGERASRSKLTQEQADSIRNEYKTVQNYAVLGRKYGVDYKTISNIVKGLTYHEAHTPI